MSNSVQYIVFGLIALAGLGFIGGIGAAGYYTLWVDEAPQPEQMPEFLAESVIAVGAVLGTNLGAVLGIRVTRKRWRRPNKSELAEDLRIIAAWFYVIALVGAGVLWLIAGFEEDPAKVVITLPEMGRTLLGMAVGALAVWLGLAEPGRAGAEGEVARRPA
jgi:hypothetical protein